VVAPVVKCERNRDRVFKFDHVSLSRYSEKRGGVVNIENNPVAELTGFTTEDILWSLGIWSVILTLSPVIMFYMLMVA
jgi:hypothetical protein